MKKLICDGVLRLIVWMLMAYCVVGLTIIIIGMSPLLISAVLFTWLSDPHTVYKHSRRI